MTLLVMSERSNASMMYLSEGCRSLNGIIVAATIRAIEGASSRIRSGARVSSFNGFAWNA